MREYINLIQDLSEAAVGMSANEIKKYEWRFKKFIEKIKNREPFTTVDGEEVIIDPREANRFFNMYHIGNTFAGALKARTTDGQEIPLSKLAKTTEFGGAAVAAGQEASSGGKEGLLVKPSQIGITDINIPASDLYATIVNNKVLNSTDYGKVIIQLANYIVAGEYVMLPEEYQGKDKEKIRKAIVDYAGEYLGVLALLYNRSRFPRKAQFQQWLGGATDDLIVNFPGKANTNLADSFAMITNASTSHSVNISSKGTGGGAAPAISGLAIPDTIKKNPKLRNAMAFIDICQKYGTIPQAFKAMDLLYKINPKSIDKKWHKYLPFESASPDLEARAKQSLDAKKQRQEIPLPKKYGPLINSIESSTGSDGGKLIYAIKREVADAINNKDAIPEFKAAILELLEMNFLQQYCDYKGGQLTFATQWPAKLDGDVSVENKSSAVDPTAGGFSFKLGRTDDSVSSEPGEEFVDIPDMGDVEDVAQDIAEPNISNQKVRAFAKPEPEANAGVGRKKRK
jgi:hypothetical protein